MPENATHTHHKFSAAPPIPSRSAAREKSLGTSGTVRESRSRSAVRFCRAWRHELHDNNTNRGAKMRKHKEDE